MNLGRWLFLRVTGAAWAASIAFSVLASGGARPPALLPIAAGPIPLTGTIHDDQNHPLPGAEVSLYRHLADLERARLRLSGREWPEPAARTVAGLDGSFRLDAPGPGNYVALARAPGRVPVESPLWPLLEASDLGTARLFPALGWRVRVVDLEGAPVAGAAVAAWRQADWPAPYGPGFWRTQQLQVAGTDSEGEVCLFRLDAEPFRVGAVAAGGFVRLDGVQSGEHADEPLVATLEEAPPRRIEARLPDGSPAVDTVVFGVALVPLGITGADGSFELTSRVPKAFQMQLLSPGGLVGEIRIEPTEAAGAAPLRLTLKRMAELVGRVVDRASRRPIVGAWVMDSHHPATYEVTDRDGEFRLPVRDPREAWVLVDAVGYVPISQAVSADPLRRGPIVLAIERRTEEGPVLKRYGWPE